MTRIQIKTDCCGKNYKLTPKQKYDLDRAGFLVYCRECGDKLNLNHYSALEQGIKLYKVK